jgi:hypothetical protein
VSSETSCGALPVSGMSIALMSPLCATFDAMLDNICPEVYTYYTLRLLPLIVQNYNILKCRALCATLDALYTRVYTSILVHIRVLMYSI